jgi:hypothetical protein
MYWRKRGKCLSNLFTNARLFRNCRLPFEERCAGRVLPFEVPDLTSLPLVYAISGIAPYCSISHRRENQAVLVHAYMRQSPDPNPHLLNGRRLSLQPVVGGKHQYSAVVEIELNVRNPYKEVIAH